MEMSSISLPSHIDLHGLTVQQGYNKSLMFVKLCSMHKRKQAKIITGRSGQMNKEFKEWISNAFKDYVDRAYQDFHRGSWTIIFK